MTLDETKKVINKIKVFRPFFQTGNSKTEENEFKLSWHEVLEPYDYDDVDKKLNDYFMDGDNVGRIPDIHYIVKYLKNHKEKKETTGIIIRCPLCQKELQYSMFDYHYERCSSVEYICKNSERYFLQRIDKNKLFQMNKEQFDRKYLEFISALKDKIEDKNEKNNLEKLVRMLNGEKVSLTVREMI